MKIFALKYEKLPDDALFDLFNHDAALWLCETATTGEESISLQARLIVLPWKVVLCESTSTALINKVNEYGSIHDNLTRHRGFTHIIASDPSDKQLPPRSLPIFFLNGRDNPSDRSESPHLTGIGANRRRLNMLKRLEIAFPKRVIIVGSNVDEVVEQWVELLDNEFRALLTFVVPPSIVPDSISDRFNKVADISSISIVSSTLEEFCADVVQRCTDLIPDERIIIRVRTSSGEINEFDITDAELIEQPLLDKYMIINSKDIRLINESDLTKEDFNNFFDKSKHSWRPFAAGLPWLPDKSIIKMVKAEIQKVHQEGCIENRVLYIAAESGAGGTTLARAIAFEVAMAGFPVLLAKPNIYEPDVTEVASFLYRSLSIIRKNLAEKCVNEVGSVDEETPWLLVFDRDQWDGQEDMIGKFLAELTRSGRSVVILKVFGPSIGTEVDNLPRVKELCSLNHELQKDKVISLGAHLNRFLKYTGKIKSEDEWIRFWQEHKPDIDTSIAAFWVVLEFWLRELIDLGESIQSWILRQFKQSNVSNEIRLIILEIAALTIERRPIPEQLLPLSVAMRLPLSVVLDNVRSEVPGLAIIRQDSPLGRFWAIAHDVLGRYLINAVYFDRPLMEELGLSNIKSPLELRLHFISQLTKRESLGERRFTSYAVQFAVKTLKLDFPEGNAELFQNWREVIDILDNFPVSVRNINRAFNHHVAISRRRVATKIDEFGASLEERQYQLEKAISQIEFALMELPQVSEDETNLNLYNSLALAYQDLATLELQQNGLTDLVRELRNKANEATLNAIRENPNSSYVLETAAKNKIQKGMLDQNDAINCAAEALGYIFQASAMESSAARQYQLDKLATEALQMLRSSDATLEISHMKGQNNPIGYLADAWIELTRNQGEITTAFPLQFSETSMRSAIAILREAPKNWLLIRMEYDLLATLDPTNFEEQLRLLEELESFQTYTSSLQLRLERNILLHLVGRHPDANTAFMRLRADIKEQNAIVSVPERLRWLLSSDRKTYLLCKARVTDDLGYRPMAQVHELSNAKVPFVAQDFGSKRKLPGEQFSCHITFGANGPFIKNPS